LRVDVVEYFVQFIPDAHSFLEGGGDADAEDDFPFEGFRVLPELYDYVALDAFLFQIVRDLFNGFFRVIQSFSSILNIFPLLRFRGTPPARG